MNFKDQTYEQLKAYLEEQEPIVDKKLEDALNAPTVQEYKRLCKLASRDYNQAHKYMQLKTPVESIEMLPHDNIGDLMTLETFVSYCKERFFINYDGHGYYATEDEQSHMVVLPSHVKSGVYRKDFTHIKWYNK